jgi:DNA-binding transcriptional ArsR family regulator
VEIAKLFGNLTATQALMFLARYEEGTAKEISDAFKVSKTQIYLQLVKLESAGIVSSRPMGNQIIYYFNPRSPIKNELRQLLEKYIETSMSKDQYKDFYLVRRRGRSRGKTLGGSYAR